jgi:spore maturation protein CgeB|tara:strand:- start:6582 stop:7499 length:918 start_codon:yes stop_codon:yes gene_type:complete
MKIVMVWNKTLQRGNVHKIDIGFWNTYYSLMQLGHEVYFYDTASPPEKGLSEVIDTFKPELVYCCMTGDPSLTPYEPWEDLQRETEKGRVKTFNWFCDDTWRFDTFSSKVCKAFHVCSTVEKDYLEKFKEIGYDNIIHGMWHTNLDFYPRVSEKDIDVSFCGIPNIERQSFTNALKNQGIPVEYNYGISHEDMCELFSRSKLSLNFSKNMTLTPPRRQIKARLFEVPAGRSLLCTEETPGLEEYYKIDEEVITFNTSLELYEKCRYLLDNENVRKRIAENGFKRFKKEHESKQRLPKILNDIMKA